MTLLFTKRKGCLLELVGLLLWVSLSSSQSIVSSATDRLEGKANGMAWSPKASWLGGLTNSILAGEASPGGLAMGPVDNSRFSGHWPVRLPIVGQNGQGLSPIPSVTGFDQIYLSHCNERVAESGATPQTNC